LESSIIRTSINDTDVQFKDRSISAEQLRQIKKALRTLHTLELMAVNIYKFQISRQKNEHNRLLIAAMCNEMTHLQDFQVKLYEYGFRPSPIRFGYWIVGLCFGFFSRILGRKMVFKTGIWVESKAVEHYSRLLESVDWDEPTRKIIEKDARDESGHIEKWKQMLESEQKR